MIITMTSFAPLGQVKICVACVTNLEPLWGIEDPFLTLLTFFTLLRSYALTLLMVFVTHHSLLTTH